MTAATTMKPMLAKDTLSSKVVSRLNHKSIMSKIKISGVDINADLPSIL